MYTVQYSIWMLNCSIKKISKKLVHFFFTDPCFYEFQSGKKHTAPPYNPDRQPWFSHLLWCYLYSIKYYLVPTVRQFVWGEIDRCEICVLRSCWDNTSSTDFYSDQGGLKVQSHEISIATKGGVKGAVSRIFLYRLMTLRRHYVPVCLHNDHAARSKISLKTIPECL